MRFSKFHSTNSISLIITLYPCTCTFYRLNISIVSSICSITGKYCQGLLRLCCFYFIEEVKNSRNLKVWEQRDDWPSMRNSFWRHHSYSRPNAKQSLLWTYGSNAETTTIVMNFSSYYVTNMSWIGTFKNWNFTVHL